jgi:hypothetical protein
LGIVGWAPIRIGEGRLSVGGNPTNTIRKDMYARMPQHIGENRMLPLLFYHRLPMAWNGDDHRSLVRMCMSPSKQTSRIKTPDCCLSRRTSGGRSAWVANLVTPRVVIEARLAPTDCLPGAPACAQHTAETSNTTFDTSVSHCCEHRCQRRH